MARTLPLTVAVAAASILALTLLPGCAGPAKVEDPLKTLATPELPGRDYIAAMTTADRSPDDEAYVQALRHLVVSSNYVVEARRAAYSRLYEHHRDKLKATLDLNLPKLDAYEWRREICERIGEDNWKEMTPTLIRAWAIFVPAWAQLTKDRPERLALVAMYGEDHLVDVLVEQMAKANPVTQANLRARCWELLLLEGQEDRLRASLASEAAIGKDAMMLDIRAGVVELGILPRTREEIVWVRSLRQPENQASWDAAKAAVAKLPEARRATLELRDLPVLVAVAARHPEWMTASDAELDSEILSRTGGADRRVTSPDFEGYNGEYSERFTINQPKLTWGDRAAMLLALDAFTVPELRRHLFEAADRDLGDKGAEHGGLIDVDSKGRF